MKTTDQKRTIRKEMLSTRAKLPAASKAKYDDWICSSLLKIIEQHQYKVIHCYIPMGTEINISPFIETLLEKGLTVVTPKTLPQRTLKHLVLKSLNKLEKGVFGTVHPKGDIEFKGNYDLIIIPGLAFDNNNYRLGYGGGYYDNFIINHPSAKKIGIFYPFQKFEKVPAEPHDVQLDEILVNADDSEL